MWVFNEKGPGYIFGLPATLVWEELKGNQTNRWISLLRHTQTFNSSVGGPKLRLHHHHYPCSQSSTSQQIHVQNEVLTPQQCLSQTQLNSLSTMLPHIPWSGSGILWKIPESSQSMNSSSDLPDLLVSSTTGFVVELIALMYSRNCQLHMHSTLTCSSCLLHHSRFATTHKPWHVTCIFHRTITSLSLGSV